ncbi:hypothetical protein JB92DRAFT_3245558 [Gautieria morchelliformis]|nr:hypothetical protein JB92DRAFT_3245558 [Gautieria morchelliformis]
MNIAELLNPADKLHMFEGTDEDIYQSVMDVKKAQEENKDNSDNIDNDIPIEPAPTYNEALQPMLLLRRYVRDIDDPSTRPAPPSPNPKSLEYHILPHIAYSKASTESLRESRTLSNVRLCAPVYALIAWEIVPCPRRAFSRFCRIQSDMDIDLIVTMMRLNPGVRLVKTSLPYGNM